MLKFGNCVHVVRLHRGQKLDLLLHEPREWFSNGMESTDFFFLVCFKENIGQKVCQVQTELIPATSIHTFCSLQYNINIRDHIYKLFFENRELGSIACFSDSNFRGET